MSLALSLGYHAGLSLSFSSHLGLVSMHESSSENRQLLNVDYGLLMGTWWVSCMTPTTSKGLERNRESVEVLLTNTKLPPQLRNQFSFHSLSLSLPLTFSLSLTLLSLTFSPLDRWGQHERLKGGTIYWTSFSVGGLVPGNV